MTDLWANGVDILVKRRELNIINKKVKIMHTSINVNINYKK